MISGTALLGMVKLQRDTMELMEGQYLVECV